MHRHIPSRHPLEAVFRHYRYLPRLAARHVLVAMPRYAKLIAKHVDGVKLSAVRERLARCHGYADHHALQSTMQKLAAAPATAIPDVATMRSCFTGLAPLLVQLDPRRLTSTAEFSLLESAAETIAAEFEVDPHLAHEIVAQAHGWRTWPEAVFGGPTEEPGPAYKLSVDRWGVGRFELAQRVQTRFDVLSTMALDLNLTDTEISDLDDEIKEFVDAEPDMAPALYLRCMLFERQEGYPDADLLLKAVAIELDLVRRAQPKLKRLPFERHQPFYESAMDSALHLCGQAATLREAADIASALLLLDPDDNVGIRYMAAVLRSAVDDHAKAESICRDHLCRGVDAREPLALLTVGLVRLNAMRSDEDTTFARASLIEAALRLPGLHALAVTGRLKGRRRRGATQAQPELYDAEELFYVFDTHQPEAMLSVRQLYSQEEVEEVIQELGSSRGPAPGAMDLRLVALELAQQPMALVTPESGRSVKPQDAGVLPGEPGLAVRRRLLAHVRRLVDDGGVAVKFDAPRWLDQWLGQPLGALGGRRPIELLAEPGGEDVVTSLVASMASGSYR